MRDLLVEDIGLPEAAVPTLLSHPVQALAHTLHGALCVHLNCIEPSHADMLASIDAVACVCPRATVYFGRALPGPVAMLREAGVRIALGTDAMLCLDTPNRISVLDEMRLLSQCNAAPALELLAMATINGAEALGLDPSLVDLRPGPTAGVIEGPSCSASTAMERVLASCSAPTWVVPPT
jgi:5-methylthioadenosine/S-adenosylhomocysteine deaminase